MRVFIIGLFVLMYGCSSNTPGRGGEFNPSEGLPDPLFLDMVNGTPPVQGQREVSDVDGMCWSFIVEQGGFSWVANHFDIDAGCFKVENTTPNTLFYRTWKVARSRAENPINPLLPPIGAEFVSLDFSNDQPTAGEVWVAIANYQTGNWEMHQLTEGSTTDLFQEIEFNWQVHSPTGWIYMAVLLYNHQGEPCHTHIRWGGYYDSEV